MYKFQDALGNYYKEMADHELLGPEGEIALAKEIEDREIEVWRRLLSFAPAMPLILETLEDRGSALPRFKALRRAATMAERGPSKANKDALAGQVRTTAAQIRDNDRDRIYLDAALAAVDEQEAIGRGRHAWRRGLTSALLAAADSRQRFINANLRLVISIALKYKNYQVPLEDLIQEGNIGLIKGVDRYDYRRGYRFSTYGGWWIRHAIGRAVANTSRTVRVPVHVLDENQQITSAYRKLTAELNRPPTDEEMAKQCSMSVDRITATRSRARSSAVSLDEPFTEEGASRMELMEDPANDERSALDLVLRNQQVARIGDLLDKVTSVHAEVLRKRFGLDGGAPMTLQKIADEHGLSRERIRQIESSALLSLRNSLEREEQLPERRAVSKHSLAGYAHGVTH